ncbi:hypothetical protein KI387_006205 [Taxus chinensis]|uniref:GDSL esterase/lipase n=1 Tax=Taxus chinensis TaxID=29808 RepID=A0AA38GPV6_TAXCH|nr:hypothetical protein KI387_006205 [Taxus chinensis]
MEPISVISCLVAVVIMVAKASGAPPALFIFGDSLVDSGNNNYLLTNARADSAPNGIDYPTHLPTGRFSNGLNIPDFISENLGAESVLPYLNPWLQGDALLRGANFASAGVGVLNDTGFQFAHIIKMPQQFNYFMEYKERVAGMIGLPATDSLVAGALVAICLGANDYVNNYFLLPFSLRQLHYSLDDYHAIVMLEYKKHLQKLYELGARKIMVMSVGPLGCAPSQRASRSANGECHAGLQKSAADFNSLLKSTLDELNSHFAIPVYTYANSYAMNVDMMTFPEAYGFKTSRDACCGRGRFNGLAPCDHLARCCPDRDNYVFWDAFHPTEKASRIIAARFMNGPPSDMSPLNLKTMMQLDL